MEHRNFQLDTEWNIIHYPERPKGFGILIIGDDRNFVDEKSSFWMQNERKMALLRTLKQEGYTVFYSNLYGKNWGSQKAVNLAKRLYNHIMRTEIINDRIHIIAEGMGALTAIKLIKELKQHIRSVTLLNPILSLSHYLEYEKERKFFYKKLMKELARAYETEPKEVEKIILSNKNLPELHSGHPLKIIYILTRNQNYSQRNILDDLSTKWEKEGYSVSKTYLIPEKQQQLANQIVRFMNEHEKIL
ncbi:hydrolase [Bacillus methanolicus PB1]|uniref:Hydrolase n=1 Tax=Bacillus methanolicus PB1 TaxID=997296 RepID=I3E5U5_BACMT|nr:hypothetical protein [Bacillus methanolicus]EIJ81866.1 hydrolase [Bacillus methanolicus PB1]